MKHSHWWKLKRKIKCLVGIHAHDRIRDEGPYIVQRCLYCDCMIHRFERDMKGTLRRSS